MEEKQDPKKIINESFRNNWASLVSHLCTLLYMKSIRAKVKGWVSLVGHLCTSIFHITSYFL